MLHNPGVEESPVAQAIIRRILSQRLDLLKAHGPEKVGQAVDSVADFVGDVDEIGSSDVSGWIKQVERELGGNQLEESHMSEVDMIIQDIIDGTADAYDIMNHPKTPEEEYVAKILADKYEDVAREHRLHPDDDFEAILDRVVDQLAQDYKHEEVDEGILDTVKKVGGKVLDKLGHGSDEDLLKDLKKKAGVRNPQTGKPSMAHSDVEKVDEVDMGQYDAIKSTPKGKEDDDVFKRFREKVKQYGDELGQRQGEKKEKEVDEGLDANQKRVGQLGPTEKITKSNPTRGKLVGANESVEQGASEGLNEMDSEGYKGTRDEGDPTAKGGKATPVKAKDVVKKGVKALNKVVQGADLKTVAKGKLGKNELNLPDGYGDVVQPQKVKEGQLDEISQDTAVSYAGKRMNTDVTGKSPEKIEKMIKGLKGAVARAHGEKPTSPAKKEVKEGQEDLDAILRIIRK